MTLSLCLVCSNQIDLKFTLNAIRFIYYLCLQFVMQIFGSVFIVSKRIQFELKCANQENVQHDVSTVQ